MESSTENSFTHDYMFSLSLPFLPPSLSLPVSPSLSLPHPPCLYLTLPVSTSPSLSLLLTLPLFLPLFLSLSFPPSLSLTLSIPHSLYSSLSLFLTLSIPHSPPLPPSLPLFPSLSLSLSLPPSLPPSLSSLSPLCRTEWIDSISKVSNILRGTDAERAAHTKPAPKEGGGTVSKGTKVGHLQSISYLCARPPTHTEGGRCFWHLKSCRFLFLEFT